MNNFSYSNIQIRAMAVAVPNDGEDLRSFADRLPDGEMEKFCKSTGIYHRYVGHRKRILASDLCVAAAERIFEQNPGMREEISALVFMSQSFDYPGPATSGVIQTRLGLDHCGPVYDVTYGCAAFPFGMQIAASFIRGGCKKVLVLIGDTVVSADTSDKDDFLFGDAGAAIVVGEGNDTVQVRLETIGSKFRYLMGPFGGLRHPCWDIVNTIGEENAQKLYGRVMEGNDVFTFSIKDAPAAVKAFYQHFGCFTEDFGFVAIHQANQMIVRTVAKKLKFPQEKVPISLDRYGNTSCVSVPVTVCDYLERHPEGKRGRFLAVAFGVGMSIGVCACSLDGAQCFPIIKTDERYDDGIDYWEYLKKKTDKI